MVAVLTHADLLIILSDIDGLYDSDPHGNHKATLIEYVEDITDEIEQLAGGAGTKRCTVGCAADPAARIANWLA
jgi:glutamate 5-kinase